MAIFTHVVHWSCTVLRSAVVNALMWCSDLFGDSSERCIERYSAMGVVQAWWKGAGSGGVGAWV